LLPQFENIGVRDAAESARPGENALKYGKQTRLGKTTLAELTTLFELAGEADVSFAKLHQIENTKRDEIAAGSN
jgi:hypothetical protein